LLIITAWLAGATGAHAQIAIDTSQAAMPNDGEIIMCATRMCRAAIDEVRHYTPRPSAARADIETCSAANQALGRWIAQVARNLTTRYDRGEMSYDLAADARNFIHSETFFLRNELRATVSTGDVSRCEQLKDRAILV